MVPLLRQPRTRIQRKTTINNIIEKHIKAPELIKQSDYIHQDEARAIQDGDILQVGVPTKQYIKDMFNMMYDKGIDNFYDSHFKAFFVSGTHKPEDILSDVMLPLNQIENTTRYKTAETMYKQNKDSIKYCFSHSLGSVILNHLNNNNKSMQNKRVTIFNAPLTAFDTVKKNIKDKSNYLDLITALDTHADKEWKPNINLIKNHFSYKL